MDYITQSIQNIDDQQLISLTETASDRLAFIAPGLSEELARAISERWERLGKDMVKVILDVDPEVARLGYGSIEGLDLMQQTADRLGSVIYHQPGVRIGILIVDNSTAIFSPIPQLIKVGSTNEFHPNAVYLDHTPQSILNNIGWGEEEKGEQTFGVHEVSSSLVEFVKKDLENNPPTKFVKARIVKVFNNQFEFVELRVQGCSISRKTVSIPNELMAFIRDDDTRARLRSSYKLIAEDCKLPVDQIEEGRKELVKKWLIVLPGYGSVVLNKDKDQFEEAIKELELEIVKYQKEIRDKLQLEIDRNRKALQDSLLPSILVNPPQKWINQLGAQPSNDELEDRLEFTLTKAFGTADDLLRNMQVRILFKGVTYEMLTDPEFIETVRKKTPGIEFTHEEFDAASAVQQPLF